jgi:hypothetical protein
MVGKDGEGGGRRGEEGYFFIFYYNMGISVILTLKS